MRKLEVFFDYECPYCLKGHENLLGLLPLHKDIEAVWRPCEAHPRPETYGPHSDLCIQGMFFAQEQGADIMEYHERMYAAALKNGVDIESPEALADSVSGLIDRESFLSALASGKYAQAVLDTNDYAYERSGVWAVPSYRMDGKKLDAMEGVGVTKQKLAEFLERA